MTLLLVLGIWRIFGLKYASGLILYLGNAEWNIPYWLHIGVSVRNAIVIAILCSALTTWGWVHLGYGVNGSKTSKEPDHRLYNWVRKAPYLLLPFCSFFPDGGVFVSIGFARALGINKYVAYTLITIGNVAKMIVWGFGFNSPRLKYPTYGMAGALLILIVVKLVRRYSDRLKSKIAAGFHKFKGLPAE